MPSQSKSLYNSEHWTIMLGIALQTLPIRGVGGLPIWMRIDYISKGLKGNNAYYSSFFNCFEHRFWSPLLFLVPYLNRNSGGIFDMHHRLINNKRKNTRCRLFKRFSLRACSRVHRGSLFYAVCA